MNISLLIFSILVIAISISFTFKPKLNKCKYKENSVDNTTPFTNDSEFGIQENNKEFNSENNSFRDYEF